MIEFFGRLHPLIVHLPIGIILLAAGLNFLTKSKKNNSFLAASRVAILFGSLSALISCITGLVLESNSYEESTLALHKYLGIATALISLTILWFVNTKKPFKKRHRKNITTSLYLFIVILIFVTGHLGGSLTHGEGFLFPENNYINESGLQQEIINPRASIYSQMVQPLLREKCYECHSSRKQKGKLRLDREGLIIKGGKGGSILKTSDNESEMLYRIHLPIEDEDHMPPSDNNQLTSGEIDLLTAWIESGASFSASLSEYDDSSIYITYIESKNKSIDSEWWPLEAIGNADQNSIDALVKSGVVVEYLFDGSNYLKASFILMDSLPLEIWEPLIKLKENLVSIRLSGVKLSQDDLNNLGVFTNLRQLYLDESIKEEFHLDPISLLTQLRYLNLSNNKIGANQISSISNLELLKRLYLYKTSLNTDEINKLKKNLSICRIETGSYSLPVLPTDTLIYRK